MIFFCVDNLVPSPSTATDYFQDVAWCNKTIKEHQDAEKEKFNRQNHFIS